MTHLKIKSRHFIAFYQTAPFPATTSACRTLSANHISINSQDCLCIYLWVT